jgi:5-methylthioadenosine/S-adenosylhomocysteine deaminase
VVDASHRIVIPGLIDTHRHTWQSALRHRCADMDIDTYFGEMFAVRGPRYRPEDVRIGTLIGALTALDSGTTTILDWSHIINTPEHADAAIDALQVSGIRGVFAHGWPMADIPTWIANSDRLHSDDIRRIRATVLSDDDSLVTLAMAERGPELATLDSTKNALNLARELGLRSTIHMGAGKRAQDARAIEAMNRQALLGPDLTFVHCSTTSAEEMSMMAHNGVSASIGAQHEQCMGAIGDCAIDRLRGNGILTGLSGDTETAGAGDMFTQMRHALGAFRSQVNGGHSSAPADTPYLTVRDVLKMATIDGAGVNGLDHRVGTITPGKAADLVFLDRDAINLFPVSDPVGSIVSSAHSGNVDAVMVAGKFRKRDGKLVGVNLPKLIEQASASQEFLLSDGYTS